MQVLMANPRGFCAGVDRAIDIVNQVLMAVGAPVYVRHEVVHNTYVVDNLRAKGAVFVEDLHEVPDGATVVFSAHGVSQDVRDDAVRRRLQVFDAACPLVTKVHVEVTKHARSGRECILIGHAGHPEVEGTLGQYRPTGGHGAMYLVETVADVARLRVVNEDDIAFVTQTTLSVDDTTEVIAALRARFPRIVGPRKDDICYATQNRQDAVKELTRRCDVVLVVGSPNSSNSNRLKEIAVKQGVNAYLINGPEDMRREWLDDNACVGVTAGASAPEILVQGVVARLKEWGAVSVQDIKGKQEKVIFALPKELRELKLGD
jgi:4-hydroxy-3-methylbut-2-enyl diphosphate reductase